MRPDARLPRLASAARRTSLALVIACGLGAAALAGLSAWATATTAGGPVVMVLAHVARAAFGEPDVLVVDGVARGLDDVARERVRRLLEAHPGAVVTTDAELLDGPGVRRWEPLAARASLVCECVVLCGNVL